MKNILTPLVLLVTTAVFSQSTQITYFKPQEFDAYVKKAVEEWDVPGLSVAVVKDDSLVFIKGYGVREIGKKNAVDENTLFAAASTTKALTATAIGMLVDENKLDWDDPVIKYLPDFKLKDADLTRQITIRDLLTHRAGVPNTDFLWYDPETSTEEMVDRLKYVEASYRLRDGFTYQNVMYAVAGEVIKTVSGKSWDEFVRTRIFEPLKMERTSATRAGIDGANNVARPHDYSGEKLVPIEGSYADAIGPAGSMWTSAADMSRWMRFLLRECETEAGKKLLKESTCEELFKPQVVLKGDAYPTSSLVKPNWQTYGLGWFQQDYEGRKVDFHTGSLSGMVAILGLIRDENLGIYILANRDHVEVRHALMYRVFDLFDNEPPRDWSGELKELYDKREKNQKESGIKIDSAATADRILNTSPSLKLENYTGTYEDPLYGKVEVAQQENNLKLKFGSLTGTLEHWHYNTFRLINDKAERTSKPMVNFILNSSGKVERVEFFGNEFGRRE